MASAGAGLFVYDGEAWRAGYFNNKARDLGGVERVVFYNGGRLYGGLGANVVLSLTKTAAPSRPAVGERVTYTLTVRNLDNRDHDYRLSVSGLPGLTLDTDRISVPAGVSMRLDLTPLA